MKKIPVIAYSNLPVRYPVNSTILYSFLLYYFDACYALWGIFIFIYLIYWTLAIIKFVSQEFIKITEEIVEETAKPKSKFNDKLNDLVQREKETC